MAKKPHVKLDSARQNEGTVTLRFNYGFPDEEERNERQEEPNYFPMANAFRGYLNRFNQDLANRAAGRVPELVPANIDYIRILFQDQFSLQTGRDNHYQNWFNDYGLMGVNFSKFNCEVLFAIVDRGKFQIFIDNITNFILRETNENPNANYSARIKYIKEFKLLTTADIIQYEGETGLLNFRLIDFPLQEVSRDRIFERLTQYLQERGIEFNFFQETKNLEVLRPTPQQASEIAANFDIVLSITSSLATVIRPSEFNLEERAYGFTITNADEDDLPIIGVLDTGISNATPLAPIIVQDDSFNLTGTSPYIDNAFRGEGHGTAVAALAALGRKPYSQNYRGNFEADARLLSMKIMDSNSAYLSERGILGLLQRAKAQYPNIKVFVLTTCYNIHKGINEDYSTYAYELDKFAHENDCLIFICTGNNHDASNHNTSYDLNYFTRDNTNLSIPAESMNNVIVGGAADAMRSGVFRGISSSKEFPTIFTRKSHIDIAKVLTNKRNKNYFKPDVIECAGDYEQGNGFIG